MKKFISIVSLSLALCSVVCAAELVCQAGIDIPISRFKSEETKNSDYIKSNGAAFTLKVNYIFDNGIFIGANIGIGSTKIKDAVTVDWYDQSGFLYTTYEDLKGVHFTIGLIPIAYTISFSEKVKLMVGPILKFTHMEYELDLDLTNSVFSSNFFAPGAQAVLSARLGNCFGIYAGLTGTALVGKVRETETYKYINTNYKFEYACKGFEITPTIGIQLSF